MKIQLMTVIEVTEGQVPQVHIFTSRADVERWGEHLMIKELDRVPESKTWRDIHKRIRDGKIQEAWVLYEEHFKPENRNYTVGSTEIELPAPAPQAWMDVTVTRPPVMVPVLILCKKRKPEYPTPFEIGWQSPSGDWRNVQGILEGTVTHWQRLPTLPDATP